MLVSPRLSDAEFSQLVRLGPLVALDLIIRDPDQRILLGLRNHDPAKGYLFSPGGCIRKGERVDHAFSRILQDETNFTSVFSSTRPLGTYQHFYDTTRFGEPHGTHYVVLAYEVIPHDFRALRVDDGHRDFCWMKEAELLASPQVHPHVKAYFDKKRYPQTSLLES